MEALEKIINPTTIWVLIPIIALLGYFVNKGLKNHYKHQERMEKIRAGTDPDGDYQD